VTDFSSEDITIAQRLAFTGMNESTECREILSSDVEKGPSPSNFQTNESKLASDNGRYSNSPASIGPKVDLPAKDNITGFNVELRTTTFERNTISLCSTAFSRNRISATNEHKSPSAPPQTDLGNASHFRALDSKSSNDR
jgi:hypothetical protein